MPLQVEIKINNSPLGGLKISRLERLDRQNSEYRYLAQGWTFQQGTTQSEPEVISAHFTHTYADGYEVCVAKALLALKEEKDHG